MLYEGLFIPTPPAPPLRPCPEVPEPPPPLLEPPVPIVIVYVVLAKNNLDDALNNYDSGNYEVDSEGDWEESEPISDFREELSDAELHQPAAVDDNHIVFYNEDDDHVEVMNMIPEHHLDTLHKNPSKKTRFIKRADD